MIAWIGRIYLAQMEVGLFVIGLSIAIFAIYRLVSRRLASPHVTVRALLRHHHAYERTGLSQQECLLRVLIHRSGWRELPHPFLSEIVRRSKTKEDVFRFVSLAEGYKFYRKDLPVIARKKNIEEAMYEIARWLEDFGNRLQNKNQLKEAEFVQRLALGLQPEQHFTNLSLATTYYRMERYLDALPLFERGLARLQHDSNGLVGLKSLEPHRSLEAVRTNYEEMHAACLKAAGNPSRSA